ncbi:MAG TPA: flavin oxidoreductase, partial [Pseudomonas sp.]|nr:flavin oxidoreductase [Pseudomonas sp.]
MTFDVTVSGSDIVFSCEPDETVLDAAERAGFSIPYSCRKGVCSTCEGGLIAGELQVRGQGIARGPATGVLLCQARPCSPVEIAPKRIV